MTRPPLGPAALRMGTPAARWVLLTTVLGSGLVMLDGTVVNVALGRIGRGPGRRRSPACSGSSTPTPSPWPSLILLGGSLGDRFGRPPRLRRRRRVVRAGVAAVRAGAEPGAADRGRGAAGRRRGAADPGQPRADLRRRSAGRRPGGGDRRVVRAGRRSPGRSARSSAAGWWSRELAGGVPGQPAAGRRSCVAVALRHVPETRDREAADRPRRCRRRAGRRSRSAASTYALTELGAQGCGRGRAGRLAVGVVALAAFVVVERRSPHPLVPPRLFADRVVQRRQRRHPARLRARWAWCSSCWCCSCRSSPGSARWSAGTALLPVTALMLLLSARAGALAAADRAAAADDGRPAGGRRRAAAAAPDRAGRVVPGRRAARRSPCSASGWR